jgi:predicted acetyltransferase
MDENREYRKVDEATFDRYVRYAFRPTAGPPDEDGDDPDEDADGTGVERARRGLYRPGLDDPVAVAGYHDFRARVRGEFHRLGGVTLVATPPEHRRQGHVRELMRRMLEELRAEGINFTALWPFKRSFYRRLGWETGSRYLRVEAPPAQLRSAGADRGGEFRRTAADEWERLVPVRATHDAGRALHVDRTEAWWRERVFEGWRGDPYVYRWDDDGETRAYLTYVVDDGDEGRELRVFEASWADPVARRQLWRFLGDHDSQVETVKLPAPFDPEIPLLEAVEDPSSVTVEVEAGHMVRLADVAAGLSALPCPEDAVEELTVAVRDPLIDANDRAFALGADGGRIECTPATAGKEPDATVGVGRLSQLAVGYRDASSMLAAGHLEASPGVVDRLDALFPAGPVWLREGF